MLNRPAVLLLVFVLAGCSNPFAQPTRGDVFAAGWLTEQVGEARAPTIYCYATIADVDCHAAPLAASGDAAESDRLVGHSGPDGPDTL